MFAGAIAASQVLHREGVSLGAGTSGGGGGGGAPDTTPPVISSIVSSPSTPTEVGITWNTDEPATSLVQYGLTTGYGSTQSLGTLITSHVITLTGLSEAQTYHYRVRSTDSSGNETISSDQTFDTLSSPGAGGPDIPTGGIGAGPYGTGTHGALTNNGTANVGPGTYTNQRFTSTVTLQGSSGTWNFTNCEFAGGIATVFGLTRTVNMTQCKCGTIYFEDGGQKGWTISQSWFYGENQGIRPKGYTYFDFTTSTTFSMTDCYIEASPHVMPSHGEAMQTLGGKNMTFTRCVFRTVGPYNGTQTASVNHAGSTCLFQDCTFLDQGASYYTVYSQGNDNRFISCSFAANGGNPPFYPMPNGNRALIQDCIFLDGSAVNDQALVNV